MEKNKQARELLEAQARQVANALAPRFVGGYPAPFGKVESLEAFIREVLIELTRGVRASLRDRWSTHGHWLGDGEPTVEQQRVRPRLVARCGGPGVCSQCSRERHEHPPGSPQAQAILAARVRDPRLADPVLLRGTIAELRGDGTAVVKLYRSRPLGLSVQIQVGALEHDERAASANGGTPEADPCG